MTLSANQTQKSGWEEGVAATVLAELGDPDPPMNAYSIAAACGLRVVSADVRTASLVGDTILVSSRAREVRRHGLIAHELGHWALIREGFEDHEHSASHVGAALMLPQRAFSADLKRHGWDLRALRARHVHCSAEMVAKRIVVLRDAVVSIWDNGKVKERVWSPWLPEGFHRMSAFERELAASVLEQGDTIEAGPLLWGFAVFSGAWRRVITVCEAEQLALRY